MSDALKRNTRLLALAGVGSIAFGVIALVWPNLTFVAFLALFGAFAFVEGAVLLAEGLNLLAERQTTWVPYVVGGLASIAVGAVVFLEPRISALALVYIIAFWAIVTGIFEIVAAIDLAGQLDGDWMLGLSGILSVAFGVLVALYPRSGAMAVIWIIGLYAILAGITDLMIAYRIDHADKEVRSAFQPSTSHSS